MNTSERHWWNICCGVLFDEEEIQCKICRYKGSFPKTFLADSVVRTRPVRTKNWAKLRPGPDHAAENYCAYSPEYLAKQNGRPT